MASNDISQFLNQTDNFIASVALQLKNINEVVAKSALTIIKNRIFNDGLNAKGSTLGKYSDNQINLFSAAVSVVLTLLVLVIYKQYLVISGCNNVLHEPFYPA